MAVVLALIAGPLAAWLATAAYAQGFGVLQGTVTDTTGKPYADVTLVIKNVETNKTIDVKTDSKGHYSVAGLTGGTYNIDLKVKDQVIYQTGLKISSGTFTCFRHQSERDYGEGQGRQRRGRGEAGGGGKGVSGIEGALRCGSASH